ncbi:MAG TPA: 2-oxoacid:acceptor oxidoreductase subunit alpha [Candidatus Aenigmarchaeota archaeon]|nr:2-oxoacid:acceptor oxidoreductase subunit alpha [Candidatus Aenigmarchaeota archaeon]
MSFNILVGGKAGQGVATVSFILGKTLTSMGYYVFEYRDYQSLIKGGHNFNVISVSNRPIYSHENEFDIIVALDQNTIEKHGKKLKKDGYVVASTNLKVSKKALQVDVDSILQKYGAPKIMGNMVLVGVVSKSLGVNINVLLKVIRKSIKKSLKLQLRLVREGYKRAKIVHNLKKVKSKGRKIFLTGNEAIALGAIAAGLDIYIAYPMTPSTPVLHFLAQKQLKYDHLVIQPENEIAVVNMALGASYAGAMAMVGTSGGGFALMNEALSLQGMNEIPLVVYLAQRAAPSTGVPTYTSQGDMKFVLNAGHGEFLRVVVAPGDAKEAFQRTVEAFYLSYKYRTLSIILGDKHLGESRYTFDDFGKLKVKPERFILKKVYKGFKNYKITKTGVSPRGVPGQKAVIRATSYEHDEYGYTTEEGEWIVKMNNKRWKKNKFIKKEINKLNPVSVYGKGKNLIVSWGSTKGAILDALKRLKDFRFLQISYLKPFPSERVKKVLESSKKVVLVENNVTGLLGDVIRENTGINIETKVLKYDARPFTPSYIMKEIKKVVK